jgi:dihydroxyacetone synthase
MVPAAFSNGYPDPKLVIDMSIQKSLARKDLGKLSAEEELVLKAFRVLIADLCQQFKGGHPG